jgi:hypothetical protein
MTIGILILVALVLYESPQLLSRLRTQGRLAREREAPAADPG